MLAAATIAVGQPALSTSSTCNVTNYGCNTKGTDANERLVWLVIMEGRWENGFPMPTGVPTPEPYPRYMVVLDAMTGEQVMVAARR